MSHQGQQEDEDTCIKDEAKVAADVDPDVPEFSVDVSLSRAEIFKEPEVKPETERLPVYTEGQIAFSLYSVLVYIYTFTSVESWNNFLLLHTVWYHSMQVLQLY